MSAAITVACAVLVSAAVGYFRPLQTAQNDYEKHQKILQAAGLLEPGSTPSKAATAELYAQLQRRLVALSSGVWVTGNADTYDVAKAAVDPERSIAVPPAHDIAKIGRQALVMPVYLLIEQGELRRVVLPVYGKGMWSDISAFVALAADLTTIAGLVIHTHGETPGIGDRIENPDWLDRWRGKSALADSPGVLLKLTAATSGSESSQTIDAITGATVTTQSLVTLVNFWLGSNGYRPFIHRLQQVEQNKVP